MAQGGREARVVEAEKVVLVTADGKTRAVLGSDDANGAPSSLTLFDDEGVKRVVLGTGAGGASVLHLFGRKGVRAGLGVGGDAGPADLALADREQNLRAQLYAGADGSVGLVFRDRSKAVRARFDLQENPAIEFLGNDGKVLWRTPAK